MPLAECHAEMEAYSFHATSHSLHTHITTQLFTHSILSPYTDVLIHTVLYLVHSFTFFNNRNKLIDSILPAPHTPRRHSHVCTLAVTHSLGSPSKSSGAQPCTMAVPGAGVRFG